MAKKQVQDPNDPTRVIWVEDGQPNDPNAMQQVEDPNDPKTVTWQPPGTLDAGAVNPNAPPDTGLGQPGAVTPTLPNVPLQPATPGGPAGPMPEKPPPGTPAFTGDYATLNDFGPGNDLRFSQITPGADPRTAKLNDLVNQFTGKIGAAPDLAQASLDKLAGLRQQTLEDRKKGIQDIGRGAAAFGRIGSGVTTSQLGDLESSLQARELAAEKGLAGDAAMQEAADRRANLSALSGVQDQFFGQDTAQRNELRGERAYQSDTANQAADREVQLQLLMDQLKNSEFGRNATAAQLKMKAAEIADAQGNASIGGASDLASLLAYYRSLSMGKRPPSSAPASSGSAVYSG